MLTPSLTAAVVVPTLVVALAVVGAVVWMAHRRFLWHRSQETAAEALEHARLVDTLTTSMLLTAQAGGLKPAGWRERVDRPDIALPDAAPGATAQSLLLPADEVVDQVLEVASVVCGDAGVRVEVAVPVENPIQGILSPGVGGAPLTPRMSVGGRFRWDTVHTVALAKQRADARRPSAPVTVPGALKQGGADHVTAPSHPPSATTLLPRHLLSDVILVALDVADALVTGGSAGKPGEEAGSRRPSHAALRPPAPVRLYEETSFYRGASGTRLLLDGVDTGPTLPAQHFASPLPSTMGLVSPATSLTGGGVGVKAAGAPPSRRSSAASPHSPDPSAASNRAAAPPPKLTLLTSHQQAAARPRANLMSVRGLPREVLEAVLATALQSVVDTAMDSDDGAAAGDQLGVDRRPGATYNPFRQRSNTVGAGGSDASSVVGVAAGPTAARVRGASVIGISSSIHHPRGRAPSSAPGADGGAMPVPEEQRLAAVKAAALMVGRRAMAARNGHAPPSGGVPRASPFTPASTRTMLQQAANSTRGPSCCRWCGSSPAPTRAGPRVDTWTGQDATCCQWRVAGRQGHPRSRRHFRHMTFWQYLLSWFSCTA